MCLGAGRFPAPASNRRPLTWGTYALPCNANMSPTPLLVLNPPLAEARVQHLLPQADVLRRHLDQLVFLDVGDGLFQGRAARRGQADGFVLAAGADVGQLLGLHRVYVQVVGPGVLADDHALIGLLAAADEHRAAVLEVPQGEGLGLAFGVGDQDALALLVDGALVGFVVAEHAVQHARAAGVGQELALVADQRAGGGDQLKAGLAAAGGAHVLHLGLTGAELFDDDAAELVIDVDLDVFHRLEALAGLLVGLEDHAGTADGHLEAFAAHAFDQHAQLQFAPAGDLVGVALGG